ncbi:molybdopterin-guanine dinucleotide biosynthesis protein B [Xylophilus rhododendri]|uniref:Molybdopterin-guanine dinucleotide biosynthesis protein B n=1 Tax=Xylophilus rhododendri TaxID=2697032 RepID=A0A857JA06_9BURK|nr:molybdopterin-guanine dinucleotide biosynthesis protein B [Xylophilus rhododendri]QHJ00747.1 molybdopterin-guanine dinucleotide biosynthesis protein B [Xylophilus rhododendri]
MKVVGFAGYSGSGKTTLIEAVIALLAASGQRVGVIKHAHHRFDIDHEGKDSWRHRKAGAAEVLVASDVRLALMREYAVPQEPSVHALIAELDPTLDWVLVEGFRGGELAKIEVWRAPSPDFAGQPPRFPDDGRILAICTDRPGALPDTGARPVLDWARPEAVAGWLNEHGDRFRYTPPTQA